MNNLEFGEYTKNSYILNCGKREVGSWKFYYEISTFLIFDLPFLLIPSLTVNLYP